LDTGWKLLSAICFKRREAFCNFSFSVAVNSRCSVALTLSFSVSQASSFLSVFLQLSCGREKAELQNLVLLPRAINATSARTEENVVENENENGGLRDGEGVFQLPTAGMPNLVASLAVRLYIYVCVVFLMLRAKCLKV